MADRRHRGSSISLSGVTRLRRPKSIATGIALGSGIFALVAYLLFTYARSEQALAVDSWRARLNTVAEDRSAAVAAWVAERLADAQVVAAYPSAIEVATASRGADFEGTTRARQRLSPVLANLVRIYGYRSALVLSSRGEILAEGGGTFDLNHDFDDLVRTALVGADAVDFVLVDNAWPAIAAVVPIRQAAGRGTGSLPTAVGVVLLVSDPQRFVYPLLGRETVATTTGEALLVRSDGTRVLFLTPLRHVDAHPMTFSRSVGDVQATALAALEGRGSFGPYTDYRGRAVFGVGKRVPGTGWTLVAKIDRYEALAQFRKALLSEGAILASLLLAVAGASLGLWQRHRARYETAVAWGKAKSAQLLDQANDAIVFSRPDLQIVDANHQAVAYYGYTRDELLGMTLEDLVDPETLAASPMQVPRVPGSSHVFETVQRRKDGTRLPVEVSTRMVELGGDRLLLSIIRDISDRQRHESRIAYLGVLLRTISEINKLLVRERDRQRLLSEACRIVVEHGGFRMAWVGFVDPASLEIRPVAWAGAEDGYLTAIHVRADASPLGAGPAGLAVRLGRIAVLDDYATDTRVAPWRDEARKRGYRSSVGLPLRIAGEVRGVFSVYSGDPGAFDAEIQGMLEELAADVSFALEMMEADEHQRAAEAALIASEAKFRATFESAAIGKVITTVAGEVLGASRTLCEWLGYAEGELIGTTLDKVTHPDDLALAKEAPQSERPGEGAVKRHTARYITKDGRVVWGDVTTVLIQDPTGQPLHLLTEVQDVTNRKHGEERIQRLAMAVEQVADAVIVTNPAGLIQYVNPAFTRITGYTAAEAIGSTPRILKSGHHGVDFYERMWRTLLKGETWSGRLVNARRDGQEYEADVMISPITDASGRIINFVAVQRDVSHEVAMEADLRQAQKLEAVGMLAAGVAHDFNNLLQAMLSHVQLLGSGQVDAGHTAASMVELEEQVRRGSTLTRQLLLFARRETARPEPLDLNEVVGSAIRLLRRLLRANVDIVTELADEALPVTADRGQLDQVLVNLAVNAADAMPGGGRLTIRTGRLDEDRVWISVDDTGQGIPPAIRERIFEPFVTTKSKGRGTGLGLAVVHGIVTAHKGSVEIVDRPLGGTSFRIVLPRGVSGGEPPSAGVLPNAAERPSGRGERVLVVEDERGAREGLVQMLEMFGYRVVAAGSGEEAGRLPLEPGFDVLLTDMMLPGIAGSDLAKALKERWPALKVILMSGYAEDDVLRGRVASVTMRFLQKPFDMATLAREVRATLDEAE